MTDSGFEINGITLFYNDFYARLNEVDENKKIEAITYDQDNRSNRPTANPTDQSNCSNPSGPGVAGLQTLTDTHRRAP